MGFRYNDALNCESWVRFEAVYRHDYAHQITEGILAVKTAQELSRLIARYICDKYQFFDVNTDDVTEFTSDLLGVAAGSSVAALGMTSPRDNTLSQSIRYLRNGSGLYPTLFKAFCIWGNDADKQLMDFLWHDYERYKDTLIEGKEPYKLVKPQNSPLFTTPFTTFAGETVRIYTRICQINRREASGKQGENLEISTLSRSFDR